jgi:hypothetical protein
MLILTERFSQQAVPETGERVMSGATNQSEFGNRGRVPRRRHPRRPDRGTGKWAALLALAAGFIVVIPTVIALQVV